jgi:hypothetical protein
MKTTCMHELADRIDEHLSQFAEIDLKNDGSSPSMGCCGDYASRGPSLSVYGRKDSKVYDIPKKGEAKVKYRVRSKGVDYRGEDGEESYRTEIEIESIEPVNLEAVVEKYGFDRARDSGGRFAPGQNVSADDMADAYVKPEKKKKAAMLAGAGVAGVTAAAVGARNPAVAQGVGRLLRRV